MPRRLLSLRSHKLEHKEIVVNPPEYFDFDFRVPTAANKGSEGVTASSPSRGNAKYYSKAVYDARPWTSDGRSAECRIQQAQVEDRWIGVAIGSPSNPPPGWGGSLNTASLSQMVEPTEQLSPHSNSKWAHVGGLFRSKSTSKKHTARNSIHDILIQVTPSPPSAGSGRRPHTAATARRSLSLNESGLDLEAGERPFPPLTDKPVPMLPKLELEIPSVEFERYSVMFGSVPGCSSQKASTQTSQLSNEQGAPNKMKESPSIPSTSYTLFPPTSSTSDLRGKGRTHTSWSELLELPKTSQQQAAHLDVKPLSSSPTDTCSAAKLIVRKPIERVSDKVSKVPAADLSGDDMHHEMHKENLKSPCQFTIADTHVAHDRHAITPQSVKITDPNAGLRIRTALPSHAKARPVQDVSPEFCTSPEDSDSPKKYGTWAMLDSPRSTASSQTSIESDIFFDVKPLRNSQGLVDSEYVVTRPDSSAVQLARSISQKLKDRAESSPLIHPFTTPDMFTGDWAMPPDLQAAEHFCMSPDQKSSYALRASMFDRAIEEVVKMVPFSADAPPVPRKVTNKPTQPIVSEQRSMTAKSLTKASPHPHGLAIGIPSTITERSCESTPTVTPVKGVGPGIYPAQRMTDQISPPRQYAELDANGPCQVPPPVPRKDSKFLPRSKYAAQLDPRTAADRHRMKSRGLTRAVTDPISVHPPRKSSIDQSRSRALSGAAQTATITPIRRKAVETTVKAVTIRPSTEVSVARKISLTRKPSYEVTVARSLSRKTSQTPVLIPTDENAATAAASETINQIKMLSPIVSQGEKGHKPGVSVNGMLDYA